MQAIGFAGSVRRECQRSIVLWTEADHYDDATCAA
jgi:hypothetical protein